MAVLKNGSTLRADSDSTEPASARLVSRRGKRYGLVRQPAAYALEALQSLRGTPLASTADAAHNGRVGVRTDLRALAHAPAPTALGVLTGCMVKGFVVSAPAARAREQMGLHGPHPGNTGLPSPGSEPSSLSARDWARRGAMVTTRPASMNRCPQGTLGLQGRERDDTGCHPWGSYARTIVAGFQRERRGCGNRGLRPDERSETIG